MLWNECSSTPCAPDSFTDLVNHGQTSVLPQLVASGWQLVQGTSWPRTALSLRSPSHDPTEAALQKRTGDQSAMSLPLRVRAIPSEMLIYDLAHGQSLESAH